MDEEENTYVDNFIIYDVNMEYYKELWYTKDTKKVQENILLVMLGLDRKDLLELSKKDKVVSKYMKEVEKLNENPEFREYISYEEEQRKIRNEYRKEGYEQGVEQSKKDIIKNLLNIDMSIPEISKIVNLEEDKIIKIRDTK